LLKGRFTNRRFLLPAKTKAKDTSRETTVDQRLIRALGHPIRAHALAIFNERIASPNEIANELGEGLSQVSYHVKVLRECDCIELVKTEPRRGAVEHYYRATARTFLSDAEWARLPDSIKGSMSAKLVEAMLGEASAALAAGTFDARDDRHVSWTPMVVDDEGWAEVVEVLADSLERLLAIRARSSERLDGGEGGFRISASLLAFEAPEAVARR
jgi:hypothetical protein